MGATPGKFPHLRSLGDWGPSPGHPGDGLHRGGPPDAPPQQRPVDWSPGPHREAVAGGTGLPLRAPPPGFTLLGPPGYPGFSASPGFLPSPGHMGLQPLPPPHSFAAPPGQMGALGPGWPAHAHAHMLPAHAQYAPPGAFLAHGGWPGFLAPPQHNLAALAHGGAPDHGSPHLGPRAGPWEAASTREAGAGLGLGEHARGCSPPTRPHGMTGPWAGPEAPAVGFQERFVQSEHARGPVGDSPSDMLRRMLNIGGGGGGGGGLNLPENLDPSPGNAPNPGRPQAPGEQPRMAAPMANGPPGHSAPDQALHNSRVGAAPAGQAQPTKANLWRPPARRAPASGVGASSSGGSGWGAPDPNPSHTSTQATAGLHAPARPDAARASVARNEGPSSRVRGGAAAAAAGMESGVARESAALAPDQAGNAAEPAPARKAARAVAVAMGAQGRSGSLGSLKTRSNAAGQVRTWRPLHISEGVVWLPGAAS